MAMKLPRLYKSDGVFERIIYPMNVAITLNMTPLSYASIKLSKDEKLPLRGLVELFTPYGSAGFFRVRTPQDAYGDEITTAELEHAIAEVGDYLVKEKVNEMLPANTAMTRIFKHYKGSLWKLGSVSALGKDDVAVTLNYNRVLDAMLLILEQKKDCMMAFDFSTKPWTVSIVKKGTVVEAEGRLSRNVSSAVVSYDDTELCTRAYYEVTSKDGKTEWKSKDASTINKYGVIEREVTVSSDMTEAEIKTTVNTYLNEHKKPRVSVQIEGEELSSITGESMDAFTVGKLFRLVIPEYNFVLEDNIVGLDWSDVYGMPKRVDVHIGDIEDTVVTFLHNLDATGGGGGGGGGGKKEEEDKWRQFIADFYKTDATVGAYAKEVDHANKVLKKAGLDINPDGVLIYSEENGTIGASIKALNKSIELKVSKDGVVSAINMSPESVDIDSKRINLKGYVKATDITADYIATKLANANIVNVKRLNANVITVLAGGVSVNVANAYNALTLTESNNQYTLKLTKINGQYDQVNFSRAVSSMTADWSTGDGTVKVTAHPQEQRFSISIPEPTESITNPAAFNYYITANINGKTVRYRLVTNSTGGYTKFEKA